MFLSLVGKQINDQYRIIKELESDSQTMTFLAEDTGKKPVRLKLFVTRGVSEKLVQGVVADIEKLTVLKHPNILAIIDHGLFEGSAYYVQPYIETQPLRDALNDYSADIQRVLGIFKAVAGALDYAHSGKIYHQALQPQTIQLDGDHPYLTDFRIRLPEGLVDTAEIVMASNGNYMAPEQWHGNPVDQRTDIYSLALILYKALSGRIAFVGKTIFDVMYKQMNQPLPDIRLSNPALPEGLQKVLVHAAAKEQSGRYFTAGDFIADVEAVINGGTPQFTTASSASRTIPDLTRPLRKRKVFISYRKLDKATVHPLAEVMRGWDNVHSLWIDMNLEGGQHWWNTILQEIRQADLIITALSNDYLDSIPCQREFHYVRALNKALLPVRVGELDFNRVSKELAVIQMIDFTQDTEKTRDELYRAINNLDDSPPLPDPLPPPPDVPISILVQVEELATATQLTPDDESRIFAHLETVLHGDNPAEKQSAGKILANLLARSDISAGFYQKLQRLNQETQDPKKGGLFGFLRRSRE